MWDTLQTPVSYRANIAHHYTQEAKGGVVKIAAPPPPAAVLHSTYMRSNFLCGLHVLAQLQAKTKYFARIFSAAGLKIYFAIIHI